MIEPLLKSCNLTIGYETRQGDKHPLFKDLELNLFAGELVCLMGPNGAGKSTLLKTLSGLMPPLEGAIDIVGKDFDVYSPKELATVLSTVWTERIDVEYMNVGELIAFGRYPYRQGWKGLSRDDHQKVDMAIQAMEVEPYVNKEFSVLSDGEKQRALIARALCQDTSILMLDEPLAFLDLSHRIRTMRLLLNWAREHQRAVLLSSHDFNLTLQMADHVWLMDQEQKFHSGSPEDFMINERFNRVFGNSFVEVDRHSGEIKIAHPQNMEVSLQGEGLIYTWMRKALKKKGIVVSDQASRKILVSEKSGNIEITYIDEKEKSEKFSSIEKVVRYLNLKGKK